MAYKIYPPIGFARVGDSPDAWFVGREQLGGHAVELDATGNETELVTFKDSQLRLKRQAARFRIFDVPDDGSAPRPLDLSDGTTIEWSVHLVNRKAGVVRQSSPPATPTRPQPTANPGQSTIDPGARSITGRLATGVRFDTGSFHGRVVPLGELCTDANHNLLVLGGFGFSSSPANTPLPSFYNNPGWHDDVSDGPVTATIKKPDGTVINTLAPAWVVVGPPDYAPDIEGIVTLYDALHQVSVTALGVTSGQPSFTRDVYPMLRRTAGLKWVHDDPNWGLMNENWATLASASATDQNLRLDMANVVRECEVSLSQFRLTSVQKGILDRYVQGDFNSDWNGPPQPAASLSPADLTRSALDSTVGQGFYPGIEAGILVRDSQLYSLPFDFRIDHNVVRPGDLTALMALPWQADFIACVRGWWPSQRPDDVFTSTTATTTQRWERGIGNAIGMVRNFAKLGFIVPRRNAAGDTVFVETERSADSAFI